jgi:hypothetical protein
MGMKTEFATEVTESTELGATASHGYAQIKEIAFVF